MTVEHLLAHRSGIGDYLDEDAGGEITDYVLPVPVHELATTEGYLPALDGHPTVFPPASGSPTATAASSCSALIAERAAAMPFHDLVRERVCEPAGWRHGVPALRRAPGRAALGYLTGDGLRTNVFHLPVRGSGDGGIYSTAADISSLWRAFFAGRIVPQRGWRRWYGPAATSPAASMRYGLGVWLHGSSDAVLLEGYDAGVSFLSTHDPASATTRTVISNTSEGAWDMVELLDDGPA